MRKMRGLGGGLFRVLTRGLGCVFLRWASGPGGRWGGEYSLVEGGLNVGQMRGREKEMCLIMMKAS